MAKTDVTIISAQVPTATRAELERHAQAGYRSVSAEIRLALDEHLLRAQVRAETADVRARFKPLPVHDPKETP